MHRGWRRLTCGVAVAVLAVVAVPAASAEVRGKPVTGAHGVQRTTAQLEAVKAPPTPARTLPRRPGPAAKRPAAGAPERSAPASRAGAPRAALTSTFSFDGPALESGVFPPDTMGDVGPTQFVVAINTRLRSYDKATGVADAGIDVTEDAFWATEMTPASCNFVSDPHIRYDRAAQKWIVIIIDVPACDGTVSNRVLIAASDGPTISATTVWTFHHFDAPAGLFADYPTLGVDANALYIGTNDFTPAGDFSNTDAYVVRKSTILGAGAITVTPFVGLIDVQGGPFTPQGVDNPDPAATVGHFVGVDAVVFSQLDIRRVTDPGGTPTLSGDLTVTVPATRLPITVPHLGNAGGANGRLDALDDRLYAASMDRATHHLRTAHNIGVDAAGAAADVPSRDAARWYDIDLHGDASAPTLAQSGTVFDNAATNPLNYWIPTVAVSGQGVMAIGGSVAGNAARVNAWFSGRLPGDAAGALSAPTPFTASTFAYNPLADPGGSSGRRWGDYSLTRVDPQDDQTLWTIQEYVSATNTWGTRIARLNAPPPATPSSPNPATVPRSPSTAVTLGGTSTAGSAYYDPGAGFAKRLTATVGCGITVNAVTFGGPTSLSLDLDTSAATGAGPCAVTVTNPDGQTATAPGLLHVETAPAPAPVAVSAPASAVSAGGATLHGSVDAKGSATEYAFQYGLDTSYGTQTAAGDAGSADGPVDRSAAISGLAPGTVYHFRIVALRAGAVAATGDDESFTTLQTAPTAVSAPASGVSTGGATLNGSVDPKGFATQYAFQFGRTVSYGSSTPAGDAGSAAGAVNRASVLTGLSPSTLYHYRIVALRGGQPAATGADVTFTTLSVITQPPMTPPFLTPATPPPATPPSVRALPRTLRLSKAGIGRFVFVATPAGARGTIAFKAIKKRRIRAFTVARASFVIAAGGRVKVRVKPAKTTLKKLRRLGTTSTRVTIVIAGKTFTGRLKLIAPKARR